MSQDEKIRVKSIALKYRPFKLLKAQVILIMSGFKDVSFPQLESQKCIFQKVTDDTNLLVNLSFEDKAVITDGRPTINHKFAEIGLDGNFETTVKSYSGNLSKFVKKYGG